MSEYGIYGLGVSSAVPLPLRTTGRTGDPEVRVEVDDGTGTRDDRTGDHGDHSRVVRESHRDAGNGRKVFERDGRTVVRLHYREFGTLVVERDLIRAVPRPGVGRDTLVAYVLGVGMGVLNWLRGALVVHASAVRLEDRVVGFLGGTGAGKSTTAAALADRGAAVVTDDVLVVGPGGASTDRRRSADRRTATDRPGAAPTDGSEAGPTVAPGPPLLKLDPETAGRLDRARPAELDGEPVAPAGGGPQRRYYRFEGVADRRLSLSALYVLSEGEAVRVEGTSPREGALALVGNTYTARLLDGADRRGSNLDACVAVADAVPVRRLVRPSDPGALDRTVEAVRADLDAG